MRRKIAFVCTGNSCRSQMAEGLAKHYYADLFDIYSAGTKPEEKVNVIAIEVMNEIEVDISKQVPKTLDEIPQAVDILIKMGCDIVCPFIPCKIEDPVGKPIEKFRRIRDIIKSKVDGLVERR